MPRLKYLKLKRVIQIANVIALSALVTLIFIKFSKTTFLSSNSFSFKIEKSTEKTEIVNALKTGFDLYTKYCSDYDEIDPTTHQCFHTFGFFASAVESLESLYLLGLKDEYSKARKIVEQKLIPNNIQWVNRKEFWSRCVGSLIGIYILTGDQLYINRATAFADKLLVLQSKKRFPSFVNFKQNTVKTDAWLNDTVPLPYITAGVPELFALFNLTGVSKYYTAANSYAAVFPDLSKEFSHYYNYKSQKLTNQPALYPMDSHVSDPYNDLLQAYQIKKTPQLLKKINSFHFRIPDKKDVIECGDILETKHLMQSLSLQCNLGNFENYYTEAFNDFEIFKDNFNENKRTIISWNFNSLPLRSFLNQDTLPDFETVYFSSFEKLKVGDGYSSMIQTSSHRWIPSNIQTSSFLGEWMKLGTEYLLISEPIIRNAVYNKYGHILRI